MNLIVLECIYLFIKIYVKLKEIGDFINDCGESVYIKL